MTKTTLFEPASLGAITLANRIVMAPLTRNRAGAGFVPGDLTAEYYAQRASAGLIISEATQISQQGQGYQDTPGIYTKDQIDGWRKVTAAVHAKGGRIVMQLWHVGRVSHVDLQPSGGLPVAPSAIRAATKTFVNNGFVDVSEPRALEIDELAGIVDDFRKAAAMPSRPVSMGSRFTGPTAICSSSSQKTAPMFERMPMAAPWKTARVSCSKSPPRWHRKSARSA